jgi:hypothetical protein
MKVLATGMRRRGKAHQRVRRALADDAVAGQDHRRLGVADQLRRLDDLASRRFRRVGRLHRDRRLVHRHLGDVLREVDERGAGLFGLRHLEGLAHDLGHDRRVQHLGRVFGDGLEHAHQVQDLVAFLVQACRRALAGDGDHRRAVHVGVGYAGDQIRRPRPERRHAHAGAPG